MTSVFPIVTPDDRAHGIANDCEACPVARAATRALQTVLGRPVAVLVADTLRVVLKDVTVMHRHRPEGPPCAYYFDVPLAEEVHDFIMNFDAGRTWACPGTLVFEIPIPDDLPPPNRRLVQ